MSPDDLRALSPLLYSHVNSYGVVNLDLSTRLPIDAHFDQLKVGIVEVTRPPDVPAGVTIPSAREIG